ncbi:MAG: penicillin-binding protein 2 [Omnitrophica bacterium]|nr:penicillin-binding protein 2 [Candidatus Omnitrophota bacterium]
MYKKSLNSRLYLIFLFFILSLSFLVTRLIYVQIFRSPKLKVLASGQYKIFTEIQPKRGTIFDRNLKELAVNAISYSIFATKEFSNEEKTRDKLVAVLKLEKNYLAAKLNSDKNFIWLKRKVNPKVSRKIRNLNLSGIGQLKEYKRLYANGSLASHLIGFTDIDNKGLEGIELYYDSYLSGIKGWRLAQRDAKRRELIVWGYKAIEPCDGYNLVLTIDSVIQNIAESHLRKAARKYKATSATAIVMDPRSGEILALCNYPDYDLNSYQDYEVNARRNLALTDIIEPGSSFKFVLAAAALEEKQVKPEDIIFCEEGQYRIGRRVLHDYRPYGKLSFKEVIERSSNIGVVKVAQTLGSEVLYSYIKKFGFGNLTGMGLPGEVKGILRSPNKWSSISITSVPIGQEVAVTPLQLISAISCVANDGVLLKPKILRSIQRQNGEIIKSFPTQEVRRVISIETARTLKEILAGVVENGTGKRAKVPGHKTAGKTGTAQKAKPKGGYYKHKYVSSFIGFVPADEPVISILVIVNEPRLEHFGSRVCAPVFKKIATETLRYLEMSNELKRVD